MRRGIRTLIVAVGLAGWCAATGPAPPAFHPTSPWWSVVAEAASDHGAVQPQGQDLAEQPGEERPSDLDLARWSRAAAWLAAGFGLLAFVLLIVALINRRIRRRRRIRRHSVYGVELPRNRISG